METFRLPKLPESLLNKRLVEALPYSLGACLPARGSGEVPKGRPLPASPRSCLPPRSGGEQLRERRPLRAPGCLSPRSAGEHALKDRPLLESPGSIGDANSTAHDLDAVLSEPCPCDDCPGRENCGRRLLACDAFAAFLNGVSWQAPARVGATRQQYVALGLEVRPRPQLRSEFRLPGSVEETA